MGFVDDDTRHFRYQVRDELEHLLDDDEDMAEMYLTDKMQQQQQLDGSSISSPNERGGINDGGIQSDSDEGYLSSRLPIFVVGQPTDDIITVLAFLLFCNVAYTNLNMIFQYAFRKSHGGRCGSHQL